MTRDAKLLRRAFFNRDPRIVSRELLGKLIVRREGRKQLAGRIVEVEAYLGEGDLAEGKQGYQARDGDGSLSSADRSQRISRARSADGCGARQHRERDVSRVLH